MDWKKIKIFLIDNKKYLFIGVIFVLALILFLHSNQRNEKNDFNNADNQPKVVKSELPDTQKAKATLKKAAVSKPQEVTCDIAGAVKNEGVYTLKQGARLNELIEVAGGLEHNAQLKNVNRALILRDQDKIHIPYRGEKIKSDQIVSSVGSNTTYSTSEQLSGNANSIGEHSNSSKININTANIQELQKLNGIGQKKAELIVAYRQENGQFEKIEDLKQISGIGDKTFEALKDQLAV